MLVLDTSAYINGWRDHYPPAVFPGVWALIADAMANGTAMAPREVFRELGKKDDEVASWAKALEHLFLEPSDDVQAEAGSILALFPQPNTRNAADPFVIAEAKIRGIR